MVTHANPPTVPNEPQNSGLLDNSGQILAHRRSHSDERFHQPSNEKIGISPESQHDNRNLTEGRDVLNGTVDPEGNTYPDGGKRAWSVVFGCFCAFFAALTMMNSLGSYQAWISTHQLSNSTAGEVGWIFGFYNFFSLFAMVQFGPVFDAYGPRLLNIVGSLLVLATYLLLGLCKLYWHFFLVLGVLGGASTSLLFTCAIGTVQRWFYNRRGLATGIAVSGGSLGGIVFPLVLEALLPKIGFTWTTRVLALILLPMVIFSNLLMRGRKLGKIKSKKVLLPDLTVLKPTRIALMTAGICFMELGLFIPIAYISSYALANDISVRTSYQVLPLLNCGSLAGRWVAGYVGDKIGRFNTQILAVTICLISILGMWLPSGKNVGVLIAFAVVFGCGSGSNISLTPVCLGQLCKTEEYGRFYSASYTMSSFGALIGLPIAGLILGAAQGNYWGLIVFGGLSYVIAFYCFAFVRINEVGWSLRKKF